MNVVFRKFPEGDIIALFPDDSVNSLGHIESYQTQGQHGSASPDLIDELAVLTVDEYQPLLQELEQIGYTGLTVVTGDD